MRKRRATGAGGDGILTFEEMTWVDVAEAVKAGAPIMVPAGATEQHGGHLPLGADTMQGIDIAKRAAWRLRTEGIPLVVGPAIPFGPRPFLTESPRAFPGTINLSHATLIALTEEMTPSSRSSPRTCRSGRRPRSPRSTG